METQSNLFHAVAAVADVVADAVAMRVAVDAGVLLLPEIELLQHFVAFVALAFAAFAAGEWEASKAQWA